MNPVDVLRHALAAIWTEIEKDNPNMEDCQQIADEALRLTDYTVTGGKVLSNSVGLESWIEYLERII